MRVLLISVLLLAIVGSVVGQDQSQIPQEMVYAEIGRLTIVAKMLLERVQQLEKENKDLKEKLAKYEKPPAGEK